MLFSIRQPRSVHSALYKAFTRTSALETKFGVQGDKFLPLKSCTSLPLPFAVKIRSDGVLNLIVSIFNSLSLCHFVLGRSIRVLPTQLLYLFLCLSPLLRIKEEPGSNLGPQTNFSRSPSSSHSNNGTVPSNGHHPLLFRYIINI